MMPTTPFEGDARPPLAFGHIVLVPFPYTDQTASKQRPAVIVSSHGYNAARPDIIMMAITSQIRATTDFGEVWLADWHAAGLLKPSAVKPVIATLEATLVIRALGTLTAGDAGALITALKLIMGDQESEVRGQR